MILRSLTEKMYAPVDLVWLSWVVLAWHDREYLAAFAAAVLGAFLSGALTGWHKRRMTTEPEGRG